MKQALPPQRRRRVESSISRRDLVSLSIFAALCVLAPLLFGAADRVVQIGLLGLLLLGISLSPPVITPLSRPAKLLLLTFVAVIVVKEFAPWQLFGSTLWRREMMGMKVALPWTHHPEPARLLDGLFSAVLAATWFVWVRTLTGDRTRRLWVVWILAGSGAILAGVCFTMRPDAAHPFAIFGIRYTEGWTGWGTFPNRNHTASFLAMAALCSLGCTLWGISKEKKPGIVLGALSTLITLAALLTSKSRGGLVAFVVGLLVLLVMVVWRYRDRRSLLIAGFSLIVVLATVAVFGGQVMERFTSHEGGTVSNQTRTLIWHETARIWRDAPLFGHGIETFTQIFPIYQKADLDGKTVLHPESSWLLLLTEIGAVPLGLLVLGLAAFLRANLPASLERRSGFYLTAGALAGAAALLTHAVFDMPAHRWATVGFGLALLAVAFPFRGGSPAGRPSRRALIFPLGIAALWVLPFVGFAPGWSTVTPTLLLNIENPVSVSDGSRPRPTLTQWQSVLRFFPLDPWLYEYAGERLLETQPDNEALWQWHFSVARRLAASGWWFPVQQAKAVGRRAPATAITLWQDGVDRAGTKSDEVLRDGVRATAAMSPARSLWGQFISARPQLALVYARMLVEELHESPEDVRGYFDGWWELRAFAENLTDAEVGDFYLYAARWCSPEEFMRWVRHNGGRIRAEYRTWMRLLHGWQRDREAWQIYSTAIAEPIFAEPGAGSSRELLELQWRNSPENPSRAFAYAQFLHAQGDEAGANAIVTKVVARADAPSWFLRKAAHVLAGKGTFSAAVEMALREKAQP